MGVLELQGAEFQGFLHLGNLGMFKEIVGFSLVQGRASFRLFKGLWVGVFGIGFRVWIFGHTFLGLS